MLNAPIIVEGEEEIEIEYDSDGNPMVPDSVKVYTIRGIMVWSIWSAKESS